MVKHKWIIGTALSVCLCTAGCALRQFHNFTTHEQEPKPFFDLGHVTPAQKAVLVRTTHLEEAAIAASNAGDYAKEASYAKQSLASGIDPGLGHELLASALYQQGKDKEALQAYQVLATEGDVYPRVQVPYARLLLESGQWAQAVSAYNTALHYYPVRALAYADKPFSPNVPRQKDLLVDLHIAQGIIYVTYADWGGHLRSEHALNEFSQAMRLAPNSALTNYYYGYGWQHLGP